MKKLFAYGANATQGDWPVQEDGYFIDPAKFTFVIVDGFGGRGAGDLAAKMVLAGFRDKLVDARESNKQSALSGLDKAEWQRAILLQLNEKILKWNETKGTYKGGCSVLVAQKDGDFFCMSSVGACACLLLRAGKMYPILLPQADIPSMTNNSFIPDQAIGTNVEIHPCFKRVKILPGDVLLMVSGGMDWLNDNFASDVLLQLGKRAAGDSLEGAAAYLADHYSLADRNRAILLLEENMFL